MKKYLALLLAGIVLAVSIGCGPKEDPAAADTTTGGSTTAGGTPGTTGAPSTTG